MSSALFVELLLNQYQPFLEKYQEIVGENYSKIAKRRKTNSNMMEWRLVGGRASQAHFSR